MLTASVITSSASASIIAGRISSNLLTRVALTSSIHCVRRYMHHQRRCVHSLHRQISSSARLPHLSLLHRSFSSSSSSVSKRTAFHDSLFSWQKSTPAPLVVPETIEPQLVALFSTIASDQQHHNNQAHSSGAASSTADNVSKSSTSSSSPNGSSRLSSDTSHPSSHTTAQAQHASYGQQATEIASQLIASLNPHHNMSTGQRIRNIMIALLGCFALTGVSVYIFRDEVKVHLSEQTADVASRSLSSSEVQSQVNVLSAEVVRKLLNDPVIMANMITFMQTLFASPETRKSLIVLLQSTVKDPATLELISAFSAEIVKDVLARPDTLKQLTQLLRNAITEPGNEAALQVLFKNFANDEKTQQMVAELAKKAALDVLNDPQVKATAITFIKDVTSDTSVQASTGDAMWNAVKHAVRPSWFGKGHDHQHGTHVTAHPQPTVVTQTLPPQSSPTLDLINPNPEGVPSSATIPAPVIAAPSALPSEPAPLTPDVAASISASPVIIAAEGQSQASANEPPSI